MRVLAPRRVVVHAYYPRRREHLVNMLDYALRPDKTLFYVRALALRTQVEHCVPALTVMAFEHVLFLVIHERNVAILALGYVPAFPAHHIRAVTAAVEKQYRLIARFKTVVERRHELC